MERKAGVTKKLTSLPAYQLTSLPAHQLTSSPTHQLSSFLRHNNPCDQVGQKANTPRKESHDPCHTDQHRINIEIVTNSGADTTQNPVIPGTEKSFNIGICHIFSFSH
jgi:hypothetical protein